MRRRQINCNLQTPTIEKSRESRRALLLSTMQHSVKEVRAAHPASTPCVLGLGSVLEW